VYLEEGRVSVLAVVAILFFATIFGYMLVAQLVPRTPGFFCHLFRLSLGAGLGLGIMSAAFFLLRLAGLSAHTTASIVLALLLLSAAALAFQRKPELEEGYLRLRPKEDKFLVGFAGAMAILGFVIDSVVFAQLIWFRPAGDFDALAVWNLRAKFLTLLPPEHFADAFSPQLVYAHTDYPLMLPGAIAALWSLAGDLWLFAPIVVTGMFFLALPAMMMSALASMGRYFQGFVAALVILSGFNYVDLSATQYSDMPLSFFVAGTICCAYLGFATGSTRPFLLAGICAGLAAWTKNEGTPWCAVALLTVAAGILYTRGESMRRRLVCLFAGAAAMYAVVLIFKLTVAGHSDILPANVESLPLSQRLLDKEKILFLISCFARTIPTLLAWTIHPFIPLLVALPLVGVSVRGGTGVTALIAIAATCCMMIVYFLVYMVQPYDLNWLVAFTIDRLMLQIWPAAVLAAVLLLKPPERGLT
jgi:hypothetical protein